MVDVTRWVEKAKGRTREAVFEGIQDLNQLLISNTAVVTGNLRRSWHAAVGSLPEGAEGGGTGTAEGLNIVARGLELGQTYYAGNTAAYARRWEYGFTGTDSLGRQYDQKGAHQIQATLAQAQGIFEAAAARVAGGD